LKKEDMKLRKILMIVGTPVFLASLFIVGNWFTGQYVCEASGNDDERTYADQAATAPTEGVVMTTFSKSKKRSPSAHTLLVFQKLNCRSCVYDIFTDQEGKYKIRLAKGKYRLIVRDGNRRGDTTDAVAPDQERIIEASISPTKSVFNIELVSDATQEEVILEN
jgi:ribosomal protein L17